MKINKTGIEIIKKYEGCKLNAYLCPAGVWTIGYGHCGNVKKGQKISQNQADNYLKYDLKKFELYVEENVKIPLNENQFSALVSFTYNCGLKNLLTLTKNRNAKEISEKIMLYNKAKGKVLKGLTKRRKEEKNLFDKIL